MWKYIVYWSVSQMIVGQCGMVENTASLKADFCDRDAAIEFYDRQSMNEGYLMDSGITIKNVELDSIPRDWLKID